MIRRAARSRSGITLTEILISIMIMGIGMMSVAVLFPIGLARLHYATRMTRSTLLAETAASELNTRNLLSKMSFLNMAVSPWYATASGRYDPWIQDTNAYGGDWLTGAYRGVGGDGGQTTSQVALSPPNPFRPGTGLYVAYDPLWRAQSLSPSTGAQGLFLGDPSTEARFASGIGFIRKDPGDSGPPAADGLQRLTNFSPANPFVLSQIPSIFVSPEDIVLNDSAAASASNMSPVLPYVDPTSKQYANDWRYTWMFTGYQTDAVNETVFDGEVVVFENRPFGVTPTNATVAGGPVTVATDERVVEAIFGYSTNVSTGGGSLAAGYGIGSDRTVVLRWPATDPDPEVKVGGWIADVTYERIQAVDDNRRLDSINANAVDNGAVVIYPYQRCYWYQVAQKSEAGPDMIGDSASPSYRMMTITTVAPLRAKTLLSQSNGAPYHINAALVDPHVANVISRTVYTR